ncbi:DNA recombination protein RmuC [Flavobacteriales bacterium]|nr:DNA recombination protein RmuC [Flavobacteriales bacterium]MDG1145724.1 DNA recombination protein RmuC [Flavobacteriales bacterium]MDG1395067.1 DNA recombination protein RmuC [Flavobacteriales bacterium]
MEIAYLIIGLFTGIVIGVLYSKNKTDKSQRNIDTSQYVSKELYQSEKNRIEKIETDNRIKQDQIGNLKADVSSRDANIENLNLKIKEEGERLLKQQKQLESQFENMANKILEQKSEKFAQQNQKNIDQILKPLGVKIKSFEESIEDKYVKDQESRAGLAKQISMLQIANQKISQDAVNLTNALKGDSKVQGDWGEFQLEVLLEKSGLKKELHFRTQNSEKDEDGNEKRPDCIIDLPDDKNLIIDSKVSLTSYEQYSNAETEVERKQYLKKHIDSIKNHIRDLASKDYPKLYSINSPDYVLMFVPIEPALISALQEDAEIFNLGLSKNIILVSTSTLMATMRTVSFIWQQENQKKNVLEIARQSGALYEKFCGFVTDLEGVGKAIDTATKKYESAYGKLYDGRGNLVTSVEKIKKLGAKTTKSISRELLDKSETELLTHDE